MKCERCGEVEPAEIHTCTPIDPLLEALRVPEKKEWVGLTEHDFALFQEPYAGILRWVEATLKERNT
jgi:hypothetical protein